MGHTSATKELPVSPDKAWEVLSDTSTWENWLTIHGGWLSEPPAQLAPGTKLVQKVVMLGMANKIEWTVESIEEGKQATISGVGMAGVTCQFVFALEAAGSGSLVSIDADFSGSLVVGALGKAVEKDANKNLVTSLDKLATFAAA
ncbi:type II toxin-antitoxin system Rv0910 family toxin [Amycolatopsis orientalis]|uniref:type II toxin-antitoxin system Rv0910 family toxin n=1 Tax=Amycolatopsis orientalis TaxID=31958 RepID=UPI0003A02814|nr:SRPBCC family protein [Amycolatopsis orientalis]